MDDKVENEKWTDMDIRIESIRLAIQFSIGTQLMDVDKMIEVSQKIYNLLISK